MYTPIVDPASFAAAIKLGHTGESQWLDFKQELNRTGRPAQEEFARDVAQFANTHGGVLLVGVAEKKDKATGLRVADRIAPVADPGEVEQWAHQALRNCLFPATIPMDVRPIALPDGVIVAINVPPYPDLAIVVGERGALEYPRRTSHGKVNMSPAEVELHQMNTQRAVQLAYAEACKVADTTKPIDLAPGLQRKFAEPGGALMKPLLGQRVVLHTAGDSRVIPLRILPENTVLHVPFGMVRDAWVTSDGRLGLFLAVYVTHFGQDWILDPY